MGIATIICEWHHPECVNTAVTSIGQPVGQVRCMALDDCDFPGRNECPFYKPMNDEQIRQRIKEESKWK